MALYVGGSLTLDDNSNLLVKRMENVMWGGYIGAGVSGDTPEHYVALSELNSGYCLSGYKSSACCDDVNKATYSTDTNTHLSNAMCQGNYNCAGSAPLKGGISWAACGCQGSSTATRLYTYATETLSSGPDKISRQNNGTFDWDGLWRCLNFAGLSTTTEVYDWKNDTFSTVATAPHSQASDISWQTHHYGYSYATQTTSTIYYYNFASNSWATGTNSGGGQVSCTGSVCPAWSCIRMGSGPHNDFSDEGKGYSYNHGTPNIVWRLNVTSPGTVSSSNVGAWPGRHNANSGYSSEHTPMNGNRASRSAGGYNGVQHTYGAKINNFNDNRSDVPTLDGVSDVSGVSSGVGICRGL